MKKAALKIIEAVPIKLDIGCGKNKQSGFIGIDKIAFEGVDHVLDVGSEPLPYGDSTVAEIFSSHCVEHLKPLERIHFVNEAYRVLEKEGKMTIIVPHWASCRAYGDMTHQWPPVSEFWFYYLDKAWRKVNAPHNDSEFVEWGYSCDFHPTWGYGMHASLLTRNSEYQQFAMQWWKESIADIHATLVPRK